jgi:hypothetical protein
VTTNDNYKQMLQSDGEAIVAGDMNDAQRFLSARLLDQILSAFAPSVIVGGASLDPEFTGQLGADMLSGPYSYALNPGGAYPRQGTANNKVQIAPGTLLQKTGNSNGNEETLLAYTFAGTEEVTIADGDVANPRVDIIQMKLELVEGDNQLRDFEDAITDAPSTAGTNKKRRVQCTLSVKQGAAAASPTYPAPDAGYVVIAGVVVGTSYVGAAGLKFEDTAGAVAVLHDQRMPLRVRPHGVHPQMFHFYSGFTAPNRSYVQKSDVSGNSLWMPLMTGQCGRLVCVSASFLDPAPLDSRITRISYYDNAGALGIDTFDLAHANMNGSGTGAFSRRSGGTLLFQTGRPADVQVRADGASERERDGAADLDQRQARPHGDVQE